VRNGSFPSPTFGEGGHRCLSRRLVAIAVGEAELEDHNAYRRPRTDLSPQTKAPASSEMNNLGDRLRALPSEPRRRRPSQRGTALRAFLACGLCGKQVTLQDDLGAGRKKIAVPAEPLKKLDVDRPGIRAGDMIAIPLLNIGSMGGECGPPRRRHSGKGCAVEFLQMGVSS
jgi:hypothetical protein